MKANNRCTGREKSIFRLRGLLLLGAVLMTAQFAHSIARFHNGDSQIHSSDETAIRQTALDFEEGWYEGDADRMARALHPNFVMRHVGTNSATGESILDQNLTAQELIDRTRAGRGKVPPARRKHDITVLDIYENAASAKIIAWYGVDYLQLAKWNGRWVIVNVLWSRNPPAP